MVFMKYRWLVGVLLAWVVISGVAGHVKALSDPGPCCDSNTCKEGLCGDDPSCAASCVGVTAFCDAPPLLNKDGYCVRTFSVPNEVCQAGWTEWGDCGTNHCQTRSCSNIRQLQIRSCGGGVCGTAGGCFVPGTLVGNKSEGKKIEDVKVGDMVTSFKDDKIVESKVSQIYKVTRDYYFKLVADDYEVKVTAEHPFYIGNDKFEEVQNLKVGDDVYVNENKSMMKKTITSIERINEPTDAYNMTVDNTNTYFAGGFAADCTRGLL